MQAEKCCTKSLVATKVSIICIVSINLYRASHCHSAHQSVVHIRMVPCLMQMKDRGKEGREMDTLVCPDVIGPGDPGLMGARELQSSRVN